VFDVLIEAVKLVGGLVGLASGGFIVYDRVTRGRLIPFLVPTKLDVQPCLRNVTRETLIVDEFAISRVGLVAVAQANDILSTVKSVAHGRYKDADERVLLFVDLRNFAISIAAIAGSPRRCGRAIR
jgi:hypothetical protein